MDADNIDEDVDELEEQSKTNDQEDEEFCQIELSLSGSYLNENYIKKNKLTE